MKQPDQRKMRFQRQSFYSISFAERFGGCLSLFSIIFLLSCQGPHTHAPDVALADVCKEENDGKIIAVKGYIAFPWATQCKSGNCDLDLTERSDGGEKLNILVGIGKEPGKIDRLDRYYSMSDFKFHTAQGDSTGPIRLISRVYWRTYQGTDICRLDVEYAEKVIAEPSPSPSLSPVLSPAPSKKVSK